MSPLPPFLLLLLLLLLAMSIPPATSDMIATGEDFAAALTQVNTGDSIMLMGNTTLAHSSWFVFTVTKPVNIGCGAPPCILDGEEARQILDTPVGVGIGPGILNITGVTFTRANGNACLGTALGIFVSTAIIDDCDFLDNTGYSDTWGTTYIKRSTVTFSSCNFRNNYISGLGGGLYVDVDSDVTVVRCVFVGNKATKWGGAVYILGSSIDFWATIFSNNYANSGGHGISKASGTVVVHSTCSPSSTEEAAPLSTIATSGMGTNEVSSYSCAPACAAGNTLNYDGCVECPPGSYAPASSSSSCTPCPAGSFGASAGSSTCTSCPTAEVAASGATECDQCAPGSYASSASECTLCPDGQYSAGGGTSCTQCPAATPFSPVGSDRSSDCQVPTCAAGAYLAWSADGHPACTSCPPHLESSPPLSTSIDACFTFLTNLCIASERSERISVFNNDKKKYTKVADWAVIDLAFITEGRILATNYYADSVVMLDTEGERLGTFAEVISPTGIVHLPHINQVSVAHYDVAGYAYLRFFDLVDYKNGVPLNSYDSVALTLWNYISTTSAPRYLKLGETDDELFITNIKQASSKRGDSVFRVCIPNTACDPSREMTMANNGYDVVDVAVLRKKKTYLITDRMPQMVGSGRVRECQLYATSTVTVASCPTFAFQPEGSYWDPYSLTLDDVKEVVYVSDHNYMKIHAFTFDGAYLGRLEDTEGDMGSPSVMAISPAPFAPLSIFEEIASTAIAGEEIATTLTLRDHLNTDLPASSPAQYHVRATGLIPGTNHSTTVEGAVKGSAKGPNEGLVAAIGINYSGDWLLSITGGSKNEQNFLGSPLLVTVNPAATEPTNSEAEFDKVVTAGDVFTLDITTIDAFRNPTEGTEFSFSCCNGETMTKAGEYMVSVDPAIKGNPFRFDVKPAAPSASSSEHLVILKKRELELRVFPKDEYNNAISDAEGYAVSIDGGDDVELRAPDFNYTHAIEADFEGEIEFLFTLNSVPIKNSPVSVLVTPPAAVPWALIGAAIAAVVLLLLSICVTRQKARKQIMELNTLRRRDQGSFLEQREILLKHNESLQESLKMQKHSQDDLKIMNEHLKALTSERKDELNEVLIKAADLKISRLLAKGGFGVVNLGTFRGQKVAVKQLLVMNDESVKRFR